MKKLENEKPVSVAIKNIRVSLEKFTSEIEDALDSIELKLLEFPEENLQKKIKLLLEVYKAKGPVSEAQFADMSRKMGYTSSGPFFKGRKASLTYIEAGGTRQVGLTKYGAEKLREAKQIE